jgi:hypothetical protein
VPDQVVDVVQHGHAVGDHAFRARAMAEVGGDGGGHRVELALQDIAQALQVGVALRVIRLVRLPGFAQALQGGSEV